MAESQFKSRVRVGGSGFTIFTFGGQPITFCQQASLTSPQPVGGGFAPIQPMDSPYPIEIITPIAAGPGQLILNMFELFGSGGVASKVWDRLGLTIGDANSPFGSNESTELGVGSGGGIFQGDADIVDLFITQAQNEPDKMAVTKIIRPLPIGGGKPEHYAEEYHGCVITNVVDGEQIAVGTLEILKQITINFRYVSRNGKLNKAFEVRNNPL